MRDILFIHDDGGHRPPCTCLGGRLRRVRSHAIAFALGAGAAGFVSVLIGRLSS